MPNVQSPNYPSPESLLCSISDSSSSKIISGGSLSHVRKIVYTNVSGSGTCTLELNQKSVADRVEEVRVKLLDKTDGYYVVDAEVVAVRDVETKAISCWMTVHSSNCHRRKGVRHSSRGKQRTTEGIPYLSALRYGMFAFDKQIVDDPSFDKVDIRHKYATRDSEKGVHFWVEVRPDPNHRKGLVVKIHSPKAHECRKIYEDREFLNKCSIAPLGGGGDGGKVAEVNTANPKPQRQPAGGGDGGNVAEVNTANPNPQAQPAGFYNSGQQNTNGFVNTIGFVNGDGNNCVNIYNYIIVADDDRTGGNN